MSGILIGRNRLAYELSMKGENQMVYGNVVLAEDGLGEVMRFRASNTSTKSKANKRVINAEKVAKSLEIIDDGDDFINDDVDIFSFNGIPFDIIGGGALEDDDEEDEDEEDVFVVEKKKSKKKKDKDVEPDKAKKKKKKKKDGGKKEKKKLSTDAVASESFNSAKGYRRRTESRDDHGKYSKARRKMEEERRLNEQEKKQAEIDLIQLSARRDYLLANIAKLNPSKRKDSIKLVQMNIELKQIETSIAALQKEFGIKTEPINTGSTISRGWNRFKRTVKHKWNGVKKWFKKNKGLVIGIGSIVIPVIGSIIAASILNG